VLDLKDRTRLLLVSAFTARTAFYYDVSRDHRRDRIIKKSLPRVRPAWQRKKRGARA